MTWITLPRSKAENGIACHHTGEGGGLTLVMLHGVGLQLEAWSAQIACFEETHGIIAIDLPGHGESAYFPDAGSIRDYAGHVRDALPETGKELVLLGHSMGAMIAFELAAMIPESVVGIVALNAVFERSESARNAVRNRANETAKTRQMDVEGPINRWFSDGPDKPEALACSNWLQHVNIDAYIQAYGLFANNDGPSRGALNNITCPALFMTGENDPNSTSDMSMEMAALCPHGKAIILDNAAHMMPMTHAQLVNREITVFVSELQGGSQ